MQEFNENRMVQAASGRRRQATMAKDNFGPRALRRAISKIGHTSRKGEKARTRLVRSAARRGVTVSLPPRGETYRQELEK